MEETELVSFLYNRIPTHIPVANGRVCAITDGASWTDSYLNYNAMPIRCGYHVRDKRIARLTPHLLNVLLVLWLGRVWCMRMVFFIHFMNIELALGLLILLCWRLSRAGSWVTRPRFGNLTTNKIPATLYWNTILLYEKNTYYDAIFHSGRLAIKFPILNREWNKGFTHGEKNPQRLSLASTGFGNG